MRWQLAFIQLATAVSPKTDLPDPFTVASDQNMLILQGVLMLGSQHVEPGSFRWSGDSFTAQPSALAKQLGVMESLTGKIAVKNGRVVSMAIEKAGEFWYDYSTNNKVPPGLPSAIMKRDRFGTTRYKVAIHELVLSPDPVDPAEFDPLTKIDRALVIHETWSNSVQIARTSPSEDVIQLVSRGIVESAEVATTKSRRVYVAFLLGLAVVIGIIVIRAFTKSRAGTSGL